MVHHYQTCSETGWCVGLCMIKLQQRLLSEGERLTLEKATEIALGMESAIAQANEIKASQQQKSLQ